MQSQTFQCGKYVVVLERDERWFEITARPRDEVRDLHSVVNCVNGIMGELLTDSQMESGEYDDAPWNFSSEGQAKNVFRRAKRLLADSPAAVEACLDADRQEGEWGFSSDEAADAQ